MSVVHCKVPRAGLGNQLFPILKGHVFAELNNLPVIVTGYYQFRIGPYLRREKSKRNYSNYFKFQKNILAAWFDQRSVGVQAKKGLVAEPRVERLAETDKNTTVYQFFEHPHYHDYFSGLRENRDLARKQLQNIIRREILDELNSKKPPVIGVHIRMGDFRKLKEGEDFSQAGSARTPENYFIDCIRQIRSINGSCLPVSIFTDGYRHELQNLLALENVEIIEGNKDIVDLLLLSRSKIIITSAGSTFSYWSGFLADAPVIMHPDHIYAPLRPADVNSFYYEGPMVKGNNSDLLIKNITEIQNKVIPV